MVKLRFPQNLRFFLFFIVYLAAPSPVWHTTYTAGCVTAAWCYCSAAGAAQSRPVLQSGDLPPATTSDQHQSAGEPQKLLPVPVLQTSVPISADKTPGHQSAKIQYNIIKHAYMSACENLGQDENKTKNTSRQKV